MQPVSQKVPKSVGKRFSDFIKKNWRLYVLLLPAFTWLIVFCYTPMYGVLIAFKDFKVKLGILNSPWCDPLLSHFYEFFRVNCQTKRSSVRVNAVPCIKSGTMSSGCDRSVM